LKIFKNCLLSNIRVRVIQMARHFWSDRDLTAKHNSGYYWLGRERGRLKFFKNCLLSNIMVRVLSVIQMARESHVTCAMV
jgi:hypothetical protein